MHNQRFCPCCHNLIYEDITLEGAIDMPAAEMVVTCGFCSWRGEFGALNRTRAHMVQPDAYVLDYQI